MKKNRNRGYPCSCFCRNPVVRFNIRRTPIILPCLWLDEMQVLFCRSWRPCGCGTHVCFFFFCWRAGMYVSYHNTVYVLPVEFTGCKNRQNKWVCQFSGDKNDFFVDYEPLLPCRGKIFQKNGKNVLRFRKKALYLHPQLRQQAIEAGFTPETRPIRLSVRTPDFHSGKRGSTPLWATK